MASGLGIIPNKSGYAYGYKTTKNNGFGRHITSFKQEEGEYYEDDLPAAGSGTCVKGFHVTSPMIAWFYFGVDASCEFWRVRFKIKDLLDCDGNKCRIRGGVFKKIQNPFYEENKG